MIKETDLILTKAHFAYSIESFSIVTLIFITKSKFANRQKIRYYRYYNNRITLKFLLYIHSYYICTFSIGHTANLFGVRVQKIKVIFKIYQIKYLSFSSHLR